MRVDDRVENVVRDRVGAHGGDRDVAVCKVFIRVGLEKDEGTMEMIEVVDAIRSGGERFSFPRSTD